MDDSNNNNNNNNNLPLRVSFVYSLKKQIYSVSPNKGDKTRSLLFSPPLLQRGANVGSYQPKIFNPIPPHRVIRFNLRESIAG